MECDTLVSIALKFDTTTSDIARANNKLGNSCPIYPGEVSLLMIPLYALLVEYMYMYSVYKHEFSLYYMKMSNYKLAGILCQGDM